MNKYYKHKCACGCGGRIEIKEFHKYDYHKVPKYIAGHNIRINNPMNNPETVKKVANSLRGRKSSEKTKKLLSDIRKGKNNSFYGKHHTKKSIKKGIESRKWYKPSKETIEKMRIGNTGKKRTEEQNRKQGERQLGENNPNWRGGKSCEIYCSVWSDKEYKNYIKERDGNKCLNPECNKKSNKLHLHHINYNKKDCRPSNLITICNSCNSRANFDRDWHQSWYSTIMYRRYNNK